LITKYKRNDPVIIREDVVIHLAGLAHDTSKVSNDEDYFQTNTEFTKVIFDAFIQSRAKKFIFLSSVKAAADIVNGILTEDCVPDPQTPYGKSKLKAEQYIISKENSLLQKQFYILRPSMVYGEGNKGNLNTLYRFLSKGYPWPLGAYKNERSYCAIENLLFVIKEIIIADNFTQGIYNVCDDDPISTNELVEWIQTVSGKRHRIFKIPTFLIATLAILGENLGLPFDKTMYKKLTDSYIVSNMKLISTLGKPLPIKAKFGIPLLLKNFKKNVE
jgi:nucleoside-diphosphate-sugar epimerase